MSLDELCKFVGQTVTIFITGGGVSGCGLTGVLLRVNSNFVTLVNRIGTAPNNPLSEVICGDRKNCRDCREENNMDEGPIFTVGSVCDIPLDKIVAFCHNAI